MSEPGVIEDDVVLGWLVPTLLNTPAVVDLLPDPTWVFEGVMPTRCGNGPGIVVQLQSSVDVRGVSTARIMANDLWIVKAEGRAEDSGLLTQIAQQIDLAISDTTAHVAGGTILMCHRESRYRSNPVDEQGTTWRSVGGIYRIYSQ